MESAWAAGVFDTRGTVTLSRGRKRVAVKIADEVIARRFAAAVREGKVYGPYGNASMEERDGFARRPSFLWIAEQEDAERALDLLQPFLSEAKLADIHRVFAR